MDTENCEDKLSLSTTLLSPPPPDGAQTSEATVREWILRFATNCGQPLNDGQVLLWIEQFAGADSALLQRAFQAVLQSHTFSNMPTVGEIYAKLDELRQADFLAEEQIARARWLSDQPSDDELHSRGVEYCSRMRDRVQELATLQGTDEPKLQADPLVIAWPERLAELEEQKKAILSRYGRATR